MDEKKQFAERLRAAMRAAGYEARPNVLEQHFNERYWGRSVTYQGARRWLMGLSIPEQDKLQVLAQWLGVEPQTLRYGTPAQIADATPPWPAVTDPADRAAISAFLALPPDRRKPLRELIAQLGVAPRRRR
ncbi:MAG: transcriptional regulator [Rhodanobacter denitrificans]|uniref:Transcriptional regulator n=1 Tax=Rhodanobacter denitrificans TaxID=666685 RepID=A0A2W5K917_9GAMM|nr:MAG: transcriptional regulator [Rhodanobacter denitrificans]